ncbi:polysaccharide biosynthesis tyrosine autokinase [Burkholderia ubonensis]|uniref:polysaccharide biosynthesis tyrosine autokinase n=1 Tax=Burkholderia ubonensis TaxID=101571 RepID=UPI000759D30D|nr:polysaccharide biosynthesis tyrosine autokinase [Burkholderia ubonensis]KVA21215.1 tyrosine protein kinase [Burkholderia ubonensis]KVA29951.1 tyrosine protein kinase [Burkholderia ubonensis]KVA35156.1 tyrosine protein kinase [Burkholderia ubonensis]
MTSLQSPKRIDDRADEVTLAAVLDVLLSHRWTVALTTAACFAAGMLYAFLCHPLYQADILVQVEDSNDASAVKSAFGDVSSLFDVKSTAAAEAQVLASRFVVTRAVDTLRSYIVVEPKRFPIVGDFISRLNSGIALPGVLGIGGYAWGDERAELARFDVPKPLEGDRFELTMLDADRYQLAGSALPEPVTGQLGRVGRFSTDEGPIVINVTRFDAYPGTAFTLVRESRTTTINALRRALDVQEKIKQSGVIVATLRGPDPLRVQAELREIANHYIRQNIERKSADAAQSLSFLGKQLPQLKQQLQAAEQRYTNMRNANGTVDLSEESKLILQQTADAKTRLLELRQKRDEMMTRFTPDHPDMLALGAQIATLERQQQAFDQQVKRLPDLQQEALRLMLDVKVDTDLYTGLLANAQQLELVKAGKTGNVRLVDAPIVPEKPVRPNRPAVIGIAASIGLLLGTAIAFARDFLFGGVDSADEIERRLGVSVYATIPDSVSQRKIARQMAVRAPGPHLLGTHHPCDPAIESLRSLCTALHFAMQDARNNVLLLSSPVPGAGKSFVSANFAALLAATGLQVLLIDGDLRRGHLHAYFGVTREYGFRELAAGAIAPQDAIHANVVPNLDFIATGEFPPNPTELLADPRITAAIGTLSARYDVVVVDSAPILPVTDAVLLGRCAGTALLVARAGKTRVAELSEAIRRLAHGGIATSGVLLNGVDSRSPRYGTRHGAYRYSQYDYAPVEHHAASQLVRVLRAFAARVRQGGVR